MRNALRIAMLTSVTFAGPATTVAFAQRTVAVEPSTPADTNAAKLLARPVTVHLTRVPREQAIDALAANARVVVQYKSQLLDRYPDSVSVNVVGATLGTALEKVLMGTPLRVVPDGIALAIVNRSALTAEAQDSTGAITGQVRDSATQRPIVGATVRIVGTTLAATTKSDGQYTVTRVPVGAQRVMVRVLGYRETIRTVNVAAGTSVGATFLLPTTVTVLTDVLTTATGDQKRVSMGNSIATIDAEAAVKTAPIQNLSDLLAARAPGLLVSTSSGAVGAPSRVRIRGISSATGRNDPIVIVDGVRVAGGTTDASVTSPTAGQFVPGYVSSPLDDIDPNSIETIDVLKGPSASTLYGSDAANGVIVIKTKRGQVGPARWSLGGEHGWTEVPGKMPLNYLGWGYLDGLSTKPTNCSVQTVATGFCVQDSVSRFNPLNNPETTTIGRGRSDRFTFDVSGGVPQIQYRFGVSHNDDLGASKMSNVNARALQRVTGSVPSWALRPNAQKSSSVNMSVVALPRPSLTLTVAVNGVQDTQRNAGDGVAFATGSQDAVYDTTATISSAFTNKSTNERTRVFSSTSAQWSPNSIFTARANVGYDYATRTDEGLQRIGYCMGFCDSTLNDYHSIFRGNSRNVSSDAGGTVMLPVGNQVTSRTSALFQYVRGSYIGSGMKGIKLAPGNDDIARAQTVQALGAVDDQSATVGWSLEQIFAFSERLYVTGAIRQDAGSGFGKDVHAPLYPKLSMSWLASEEPFFPKSLHRIVTNFRPRFAYGHAGVQPARDAAPATYSTVPVEVNGQFVNSYTLQGPGNPLLLPERSTEIEGGFDLGLFDNQRVTFDFTMFRKLSKDALQSITLPASVGSLFLTHYENIGNVLNAGFEATLTARPIDRPGFQWVSMISASTARNKLVSIGPNATPQNQGSLSRNVVGYPLFGRWAKPILGYADLNGDGVLGANEVTIGDTAVFVGGTLPKYQVTYMNSVSLLNGRLVLNALVDQQSGLTQAQTLSNGFGQQDASAPLADQARALLSGLTGYDGGLYTLSVLRIQSAGVTYTLPRSIAQWARATNATVGVLGRNLGMWSNYAGKDPGVNQFPRSDAPNDGGVLPPTRAWVVRMTLGY